MNERRRKKTTISFWEREKKRHERNKISQCFWVTWQKIKSYGNFCTIFYYFVLCLGFTYHIIYNKLLLFSTHRNIITTKIFISWFCFKISIKNNLKKNRKISSMRILFAYLVFVLCTSFIRCVTHIANYQFNTKKRWLQSNELPCVTHIFQFVICNLKFTIFITMCEGFLFDLNKCDFMFCCWSICEIKFLVYFRQTNRLAS